MKLRSKALMGVALMGLWLMAPLAICGEADEQALAERFGALADRFGNSSAAAPYRESLYDAACRLAEKDVRFYRNRLRAAQTMGDTEDILATLKGWRELEPQSLFVQMQLIDVYVMRLQTADARLNYLRPIVDADTVPAEVRSHAAYQMARLFLEQSRVQQSLEMLRKSVLLNGLNTDSLRLQWQLGVNSATPAQRIGLLLSMLKADPASVEAVLLIAGDLANAGMVQQSLQWYGHAAGMSRTVGGLVGSAAKDYAAELLIAGQDRGAAEIASRLLEKDASDPGAWFLTLLAEKDKKERIDDVRKSALIGLLNRLAVVRQAIGAKEATTRPLGSDDVAMPDLVADTELLKKARAQQVRDYAAAVSDVAWFIVSQQTNVSDVTALIRAIKAASPSDVKLVDRLEGWQLLRNGKLEEARGKLAALADADPLAAIGMVRILRQEPATLSQAKDLAQRLVKEYPARYIGAVVRSEVGDLAGEAPPDASAEAIRDQLDRFPKDILKLVTAPQDFLRMRLQPQQVGHDYGEPILLEVELRNLQEIPLVVGPDGMARDLWLDVQTHGLRQEWYSGVCFEKIDGPVILQPGTTIRWVTRLDRGPLAEFLERNVQQAEQMTVLGITNAVPTEQGVVAGACGITGRMSQMAERRASSLLSDAAMRKARTTVDGTDGVAKIRLVDQLAAYLKIIADPEGPADVKAMNAEFQDLLRRLSQDSSVPVRAWARYRMAQLGLEAPEKVALDLAKEQSWYARMIGALCTMDVSSVTRTTLLQGMEKDQDRTVRDLVAAIPGAMSRPATREIPAK